MKCSVHSATEAQALCRECNRALCNSCVNRFRGPVCESCLLRSSGAVAREVYVGLSATLSIFAATTWFLARMVDSSGQPALPISSAALIGALFACTYWGWKFLSTYFPSLWFGTGIVWMIYVILKFIASYFIGLIVGPFQIIRMLNQLRIVNRVKHQIASGEL
jgi:hypothetical protein